MNVQYTVSKPILKEVNLQKTKLASYDNYQQKIVKNLITKKPVNIDWF